MVLNSEQLLVCVALLQSQRIVMFIQMELCYSNLHDWLTKRNNGLFANNAYTGNWVETSHIERGEGSVFTCFVSESALELVYSVIHCSQTCQNRVCYINRHNTLSC